MTELEQLRDKILAERDAGNIVFWGLPHELATAKLDDFIKQPVDGILYDLNRTEEICLTFLAGTKWVNDFAVALVIRKLHAKLRECKPVLVARREALREEAGDWDEAGDLLSASEAREEAALVDALLATLPRDK